MDSKTYIASGILELYVYGALSEQENAQVYEYVQKYPEVREEVVRIETTLMQLAAAAAPSGTTALRPELTDQDQEDSKVIALPKKQNKLLPYIGWAAAVALLIGMFTQYDANRQLKKQVTDSQLEQELLEGKLRVVEEELTSSKELLSIIRDTDILRIPLAGQAVAPEAYASVYWDEQNQQAFIDAAGLPAPPTGKVYQVWSLTLNPLTPTSMGLLDDFENDDNKIFVLDNPNQSQAFGITLEPEGGSETPTLEQLYTLGALSS